MRRKLPCHVRSGFTVLIGVGLALLLPSCAEPPPQSVQVSIGTGGLGGSYDRIGLTFARLVREQGALPGYSLQTENSSGSVANIEALSQGRTMFGIAQSDHQHRALGGIGEWAASGPRTEIRSVFSLYPEYVTIVAGADTDIGSVSGLKDKVVDIGAPASGTQQNAIDVLDAARLDWQTDIQARQTDLDGRLSAFMRGEIDAFFFTTGHPSQEIKFASFSARGIRLIPPENVDALTSEYPFYTKVTIPTASYRALADTGPVGTIGVAAVLLTSQSAPADVVYELTRTILENLDALTDDEVDVSALRARTWFSGVTAPLHPGALKYYDEIGVAVPANIRSGSATDAD